jgi:hypothetical protein
MTVFSGNDAGVRFHVGGAIEVRDVDRDPQGRLPEVWNAGPTIKADGSIEFQGQLLARVHGDGTITDKAGKPLPLTIRGDRLAFTDRTDAGIELTADGTLTPTWPRSGPVLRVEGADTPGKHRTVLAVVGLLFAPQPPDAEAGAPQETTAPPK